MNRDRRKASRPKDPVADKESTDRIERRVKEARAKQDQSEATNETES